MPTCHSLFDYYLHQHTNINRYLEQCIAFPEPELVHQLRLSVKKLRAFNKLTAHLFHSENVEHIHFKHRIKGLFKIAGQLRDIQVQVHLLTVYEEKEGIDCIEFSQWLVECEQKKIAAFIKKQQGRLNHAGAPPVNEKLGKALLLINEPSIVAGGEAALESMGSKIRKLAGGNISSGNLHQIRKIVKQIRYVISILKGSYPDFNYNKISIKSLYEIEVCTGNWHDCLVRVDLVEKFVDKKLISEKSVQVKYQNLLNSFSVELDAAYESACKMIRSEFTP
jgi:CHAD domain-containing protein